MKFTCGLSLTLPLVLVLLLVVATKGHTVIQCYVCDNCEKVDKTTPLEQCGGENFSTTTMTSTSMLPSESTTTTTTTSTTMSPSEATTTSKSTPMPQSDISAKPSTEYPITANTSEFSTPSTNGSTSATIDQVSTPEQKPETIPDDDEYVTLNETANVTPTFGLSTEATYPGSVSSFPSGFLNSTIALGNISDTSDSGHNRQRRHTQFNNITYYCYKVEKQYGKGFGIKRGCIGVELEHSACTDLRTANDNKTRKCSQCTTTLCNGSSTIGVSIATLLFVLLALIYKA